MKTEPKHKRRIWIPLLILAAVILLIAALVPVVVPAVGKWFTDQEGEVRDGWAVDVGDLVAWTRPNKSKSAPPPWSPASP